MLESFISFLTRYSLFFLISFVLLVGGYLGFLKFLYWGEIQLYISDFPAEVWIDGGEKNFVCQDSFCMYRVSPGIHDIVLIKKGFEDFAFSLEVPWRKSIEKNIIFSQKSLSLHEYSAQRPSPKPPLANFSLRDNSVYWNGIFLSKFSSLVQVVSDEVGRGVWMVSDDEVQFFDRSQESIATVLHKEIQNFSALPTGGFILEDIFGQYWSWQKNKVILLDITPLGIKMVCMSGKNFVFLSQKFNEIEIQEYDPQSQEKTSKGVLESLDPLDIFSLECSSKGGVKIFLSSGKVLDIGF